MSLFLKPASFRERVITTHLLDLGYKRALSWNQVATMTEHQVQLIEQAIKLKVILTDCQKRLIQNKSQKDAPDWDVADLVGHVVGDNGQTFLEIENPENIISLGYCPESNQLKGVPIKHSKTKFIVHPRLVFQDPVV